MQPVCMQLARTMTGLAFQDDVFLTLALKEMTYLDAVQSSISTFPPHAAEKHFAPGVARKGVGNVHRLSVKPFNSV